jgi:hypothetical protein
MPTRPCLRRHKERLPYDRRYNVKPLLAALALTILIGVATVANQVTAGPSPSSQQFGGGGY